MLQRRSGLASSLAVQLGLPAIHNTSYIAVQQCVGMTMIAKADLKRRSRIEAQTRPERPLRIGGVLSHVTQRQERRLRRRPIPTGRQSVDGPIGPAHSHTRTRHQARTALRTFAGRRFALPLRYRGLKLQQCAAWHSLRIFLIAAAAHPVLAHLKPLEPAGRRSSVARRADRLT